MSKKDKSKITFVLGDMHAPWIDFEAVEEIAQEIKLAKKRGDDVTVVQVGDITDQRMWSKYGKGPDDEHAQLEWDKAEAAMERLYELIPEMHIILGNHDIRVLKKATEAQVPRQLIKTLDEYFNFDGWIWHLGNHPLEINGVSYIHGDEFAIPTPESAALKLGTSVCYGHTHQAKLAYVVSFKRKLFSMNVGWLGDETASAFNYAAKNAFRCWKGYGVIIDGVPHLIPL
jgi:predicted phosphodiesterase